MLTDKRISTFYEDVQSLGLKRPVAAIAKETGYSKGNVSLYLSKKLPPSGKFIDKFYEVFKDSLKKVSHETLSDAVTPLSEEKNEEKGVATDLSIRAIHNLTESGKKLASAHEIMASAQQTMASNEARLISLLENKSTAGGQKDNGVASPKVMSGLLVALAKVASGTRFHSEDEALRELGRLLSPQVDENKIVGGIQTDGGKTSTGK